MNIFGDFNIDSSGEDYDIGPEATEYTEDSFSNPLTDSYSTLFPSDDSLGLHSHELPTMNDISFNGHLEDLYNPSINQAKNDYDYHISKADDSSTMADLNYHLDKARESKQSEDFFQECLAEARREQVINEAHMESITKPAEIAEAYQKEIEDILNPHASKVSFGSNLGNMYDRNTLDFLKECQKHDIDLPRSVDHNSLKSETVVDRSVNGGLLATDKVIIRNTLDKYHENGDLSDADYKTLINKLSNC